MLQRDSSSLIFLYHFPATIGSPLYPFIETLKSLIPIFTSSILAVVPTGRGIIAVTSPSVWCQTYFSVSPPFPAFGFCLTFSSSLSSSPGTFFFALSPSFSFFALASYYFLKISYSSSFLASSSSISSTVAPSSFLTACSFFFWTSLFAFSSSCFFLISAYFLVSC